MKALEAFLRKDLSMLKWGPKLVGTVVYCPLKTLTAFLSTHNKHSGPLLCPTCCSFVGLTYSHTPPGVAVAAT